MKKNKNASSTQSWIPTSSVVWIIPRIAQRRIYFHGEWLTMLLCTEIETDAPPRNSENARVFYWLPRGERFFLFFFIVVIRLFFLPRRSRYHLWGHLFSKKKNPYMLPVDWRYSVLFLLSVENSPFSVPWLSFPPSLLPKNKNTISTFWILDSTRLDSAVDDVNVIFTVTEITLSAQFLFRTVYQPLPVKYAISPK